jgi:hypothetical protein
VRGVAEEIWNYRKYLAYLKQRKKCLTMHLLLEYHALFWPFLTSKFANTSVIEAIMIIKVIGPPVKKLPIIENKIENLVLKS